MSNFAMERFIRVRQRTMELIKPLTPEDMILQAMTDVSPTKWHLAHTTWFFETFILRPKKNYRPFHSGFQYLFNSYYEGVGPYFPRAQRGLLSRPLLSEILDYRAYVDEATLRLCSDHDHDLLILGSHHEEQHQELLLTDILYNFSINPLAPVYRLPPLIEEEKTPALSWLAHDGNMVAIGQKGDHFSFDNEKPFHKVLLYPYKIANRLVSCGEYRDFIEDGGYENALLWLSDGWRWVKTHGIKAPLYWRKEKDRWLEMSLWGSVPLQENMPVCHINYYEASAFATWAGKRLPTEFEWEASVGALAVEGNFLEENFYHPLPAKGQGLLQAFGDAWEWTASAYLPYPGYRVPQGAVGEYNGKFMCDQWVLRGGSALTPKDHIRKSYRNFFPANARWQMTGIRLAEDA